MWFEMNLPINAALLAEAMREESARAAITPDQIAAGVSVLRDSGLLTPEAEQRGRVLELLVERLFRRWAGDVELDD